MTTSRSTPSRYDCDPTETTSPVAENLKHPASPVPLHITTSYSVELRTGVPSETVSFGVGALLAQTPGGRCVSPPLKGAPHTTIQTEVSNKGQHRSGFLVSAPFAARRVSSSTEPDSTCPYKPRGVSCPDKCPTVESRECGQILPDQIGALSNLCVGEPSTDTQR